MSVEIANELAEIKQILDKKVYTPSRLDYFTAAALTGIMSNPEYYSRMSSPRKEAAALQIAVETIREIDKYNNPQKPVRY